MPNIQDLLEQILGASRGDQVRDNIVYAIEQCYEDGKAGTVDLVARNLINGVMNTNEDQQADIMSLLARVSELEGGESGGEGTSESTTIDVPTFIVDSGIVENITIENSGANTRTVTFSKEFTEIPTISCVLMVQNTAVASYAIVQVIVIKSSISTTGFRFTVANRSGSQRSATVGWIAIQPTTKTIPLDISVPATDDLTESQIQSLIGLLE